MSYDLYVEQPTGDSGTQLRLLVARRNRLLEYRKLVHGRLDEQKRLHRGEFSEFIEVQLSGLASLELREPAPPLLDKLPTGSWFLQFGFILAKPYMSRDDDPFYVAEGVNPTRKDKVFRVPMVAASSWKGILRWTAMQVGLFEGRRALSDERFARKRLGQTLLFGDEKGQDSDRAKEFARFLNELKPTAEPLYHKLIRQHFGIEGDGDLPRHAGRVMCYSTFFDLIDVEVINPHSRKTKAGSHPIYLECVPAGAKGTFSLLYVPLDLIGRAQKEIRKEAKQDLATIAEAIQAMMLTYGFSAKRTSGFGAAEDEIVGGVVRTRRTEKKLTTLSKLPEAVGHVKL